MAVCLLSASCGKEESQPETRESGIYQITVTVTGNSPKGSVRRYNLNGVKFRNERNGTSSIPIDECFTDKVEYSTESPVSLISIQGILIQKRMRTSPCRKRETGKMFFTKVNKQMPIRV